jgi:hypothetical protein
VFAGGALAASFAWFLAWADPLAAEPPPVVEPLPADVAVEVEGVATEEPPAETETPLGPTDTDGPDPPPTPSEAGGRELKCGVDTEGVEPDGVETDGTEADGVRPTGVETDGTLTDGVWTEGTLTDGSETAELGSAFTPTISDVTTVTRAPVAATRIRVLRWTT